MRKFIRYRCVNALYQSPCNAHARSVDLTAVKAPPVYPASLLAPSAMAVTRITAMTPSLRQRQLPACSRLTAAETAAVLSSAESLQRADAAGRPKPLLRGRNLALLCRDVDQPDALLFRRAALELGAHVSHVAVGLNENSSSSDVAHTARLLARLYDAVECQDMPSDLVQRLADASDIAVYDALASPAHPTAALTRQLGDAEHSADNRRYLLQALLLSTMA
jgi:ornithine carbamoyltransferase